LLSRECLVSDSLLILLENMGVARKLFRLFKSFNEWVKIKEFMNNKTLPEFDKYLSIATRLAFLIYWIFDNLAVLAKIKFFPSLDVKN